MSTVDREPHPTDVDKAFLGSATYRSLGEQRLSPQEERFEKARRTSGLVLAPLATIVMLLIPFDLPEQQHKLAAVLVGVVILWVTEAVPIPVGGFLGIAAIVLIGVVPADDALAPFGSSTVFTFIGAFILAQAMLKHGLAKRFAMFVLNLPGVGTSTTRVIIAFGAITALLSAFVSNVTKEVYYLSVGDTSGIVNSPVGAPRMYGLRLRYSFGQ
jgi:sodium-dependent dicarboxylate transporter 2/3/5